MVTPAVAAVFVGADAEILIAVAAPVVAAVVIDCRKRRLSTFHRVLNGLNLKLSCRASVLYAPHHTGVTGNHSIADPPIPWNHANHTPVLLMQYVASKLVSYGKHMLIRLPVTAVCAGSSQSSTEFAAVRLLMG